MGVLRFQRIPFRSSVGSSGLTQAALTLLLIICCSTQEYRAPPFIPNISFLWAWNIPSEGCAVNFNVHLDLNLFSLVGSPRKNARGQNITIFYNNRLGYYPYIEDKTGKVMDGGLPQTGNLIKHLAKVRKDIDHYIDVDMTGLGVIDWENWRPLWIRNWKPKDIYKNLSIELVHQQHAELNDTEAAKKAKADFESAGRCFMETTLKLVKDLRPNYLWGFYLFPDCYNGFKEIDYNGSCPDIEKKRNDKLDWLWKESTALFPSIYLSSKFESTLKAALYVRNRVLEAIRISEVHSVKHPLPVFVKMVNYFLPLQYCTDLDNYLKSTLNPYIINVTLAAKMCNQALCQDQGVCVRKHWNSSDYLHLNPENFVIQLERNGKYTVQGEPTLEDLQQFSQNFHCAYRGTSGRWTIECGFDHGMQQMGQMGEIFCPPH
uniref:Hyaluronidase n=1 Tax=Neovison vison TaxID=452646 RepID=A0A8C7A2U0_NEOVI